MIIASIVLMSVVTLVIAFLVYSLRRDADYAVLGMLFTMNTIFLACMVFVICRLIG